MIHYYKRGHEVDYSNADETNDSSFHNSNVAIHLFYIENEA